MGILVERSLNGKEFITCRSLLHETLPQFIKDSILSLAQKHLKAEKPITWNFNANLDFDDEEVKASGERLMLALLRSVRFSRTEVELCLSNALKLRFDLLIRPRQTIEAIFFKTVDHHDRKVLVSSLNKIGHGVPFLEALVKKIEHGEKESFSREAFHVVAEQVQREMYPDFEKKQLLHEYDLVLDLFSIDQALFPKGLSSVVVEEILLARRLDAAHSVVRKKAAQGKTTWSKEDIKDIFTFVLKAAPSEPVERERLAQPSVIFPKIIFPKEDDDLRVHRQNIERQPPGPYPSIFSFIDDRDQRNFVRKLFQKDEKAFNSFMDKVDCLSQWREAKQIIDWELEKRHLDPYCKEAVRLGDIVFAKYFSNGKYA